MTLARCTADFPDQVGERCCMEVTVPATSVNSATAEVSLLGPSLQNTIRVPLVKLKEARGQPQDYTMEGEKPLIVNMDLCCAKPQDSRGHKLQSSRVVENAAGVCPVSDLPGAYPELPASDAHRRAQKAAWERQGRPDYIHDVDLSHNLAHELERRANAVALRKRAPVPSIKAARNDAEPAEPTAPGLRKLPKEERPVQGTWGRSGASVGASVSSIPYRTCLIVCGAISYLSISPKQVASFLAGRSRSIPTMMRSTLGHPDRLMVVVLCSAGLWWVRCSDWL